MTRALVAKTSGQARTDDQSDTQMKLLRVAETLFGNAGYEAVSIRQIAAAAGVNMALIGYYFGSKESLFVAAYRMNAEPICNERRRNLAELLARAKAPRLPEILDAWLAPVFRHDAGQARHMFIRLSAFLSNDKQPFFEDLVFSTHGAINTMYLDALQTCLPKLSRETLMWRLYYLIGMLSVATGPLPAGMAKLSRCRTRPVAMQRSLQEMIAFAVAGFEVSEPKRGAAPKRASKGKSRDSKSPRFNRAETGP